MILGCEPILNFNREDFSLHLDASFWLEECGISPTSHVFISDEGVLKQLNESSITLVDHNDMDARQVHLAPNVVRIRDHHAISNIKFENATDVKIPGPSVGSCASLIALELDESHPTVIAKLLLAPILIDTANFDPEVKGRRWGPVDVEALSKLKEILQISDESINQIYMKLSQIKFDKDRLLGLGIKALLRLDEKLFNWGKHRVAFSSFPVSLPDAIATCPNDLDRHETYKAHLTERGSDILILMSSTMVDGRTFQKYLGIFATDMEYPMVQAIINSLESNSELALTTHENNGTEVKLIEKIYLQNSKLSRKQVAPLIEAIVHLWKDETIFKK